VTNFSGSIGDKLNELCSVLNVAPFKEYEVKYYCFCVVQLNIDVTGVVDYVPECMAVLCFIYYMCMLMLTLSVSIAP